MQNVARIICIVVFSLFSHRAFAQDTVTVCSGPKVGLVLSGGGAKGAAHIGVIKYIEEAGIPIDYIVVQVWALLWVVCMPWATRQMRCSILSVA